MRAVWIGLLGVFSLGCSDDKSAAQGPSPGAAGADGGGGQGNGGGASDTAKLRWQVTELSSNPTPVGIEGVDICVHEHADIPCVKTDKDGFFDLPGLPRDTALNVTFAKTGYVPAPVRRCRSRRKRAMVRSTFRRTRVCTTSTLRRRIRTAGTSTISTRATT